MPYFFAGQNLEQDQTAIISGDEARHILLSHRVKAGEVLKVQGRNNKRFLCKVVSVGKKELGVLAQEEIQIPKELSAQVDLFVSVVSEKTLDLILQKATELGASKIILFNSQNTATKLTFPLFEKKIERWTKILMEAAKQSERGVWPQLEFKIGIEEIKKDLIGYGGIFLADLDGHNLSERLQSQDRVALLVGPEGGFSKEETLSFKNLKNLELVKLSPFVLRTETAVLALLSNIVAKVL